MSRLTKRVIDEVLLCDAESSICKEVCKSMDDFDHPCDVCPINEAIQKLAYYEDLEEQGRLIEQKHGRWIHKDNFIGKYLMCSECSHVTGRKSKYCPNCGAKMDEVK